MLHLLPFFCIKSIEVLQLGISVHHRVCVSRRHVLPPSFAVHRLPARAACSSPKRPCCNVCDCVQASAFFEDSQCKVVMRPKSTSFIRIFQVGSVFSVLPASLIPSTYTDKNSPFSRLTHKHSQFGTFSQPCSDRTFSNCRSHDSPAKG